MKREHYIQSQFAPQDDVLEEVLRSINARNMPAISVSPESGKLMTLLAKISGAGQVLEIGALGGYSGIHLMRGLPGNGQLISLELNPEYAELAHENMKKAGFGDRVSDVHDKGTVALRRFNKRAANHPKLDSTLIPIGDGITLSRVK